jgi:hypothetical protein
LIAAFKWSDGLFWGVFWNWIVGFAIALIGGYIGSALWYQMLTTLTGCEEHQEEQIEEVLFTTGVLTGTVERFFFTVGLGMDFAGMAVAMMVWTTIKLQSHYHIFGESKPNSTLNEAEPDFRRLYRALLSSLGSLFFALIGSWVCRHGLGLWKS